MDRHTLFRGALIVLTLIVLYLSYVVVKPFLITIILAFIITFIFHPVYDWIKKHVRSERAASAAVILIVLLLLIIPAAFLVTKLVTEASSTYRTFVEYDLEVTEIPLLGDLGFLEQGQDLLDNAVSGARNYVVQSTPNILGEIASFALHLFVFFFLMYFANMSGRRWYTVIRDALPLRKEVKRHIFEDIEKVTNALVYGQFLTAVAQGTLGGLVLFVFGVPNAVFWGFIMILFSLIPFLGTPLILVPAGLLELIQGNYIAGAGILILGLVVVANIDNFLRPYLVSRSAPIHPIVVLIGVFGGLQAFGFAGMIIGPLILALFFTLIKDFATHKELLTKG